MDLSNLKRRLLRLGYPEQPRAERHGASGLAASYEPGSPATPAPVKDISSSGIYLVTEKRLRTGELITLTLQEDGERGTHAENQISIHAKVARQGQDGLGLSFVLPPGVDTLLWGVLVRNIVTLSQPAQIAHMFRTLRTVLFLCQLCQSDAHEAILLLDGQLDHDRTENLLKIALATQGLLASETDGDRMRCHPTLLATILREGSWTTDETIRRLWVNLLVASCSVEAPDNSNHALASLLIHISPPQASIFLYACERALSVAPGVEIPPSGSIVLSPADLVEITDKSDATRNTTDVVYLFHLGLVQKEPNLTSFTQDDGIDITPTNLGLELYKRCCGERRKLPQHLVTEAYTHLRNFLPNYDAEA
jgi:hypothetical protein